MVKKNLITSLYSRYKIVSTFILGLIALLILVAVTVAIILFIGMGPKNTHIAAKRPKVLIAKKDAQYRFYKNGKPYLVKGGNGDYNHLNELAACGGNTIICWDTAKIERVLNEAQQYNISVIIGLDIPSGELDAIYDDTAKIENIYRAYSKLVLRYKDYPSLLAWSLGNEVNMPLTIGNTSFYKSYNRFLQMIHDTDPDHPVSTAVMNVRKRYLFSIKWRIPALDFINITSYNSIKQLRKDLDKFELVWNGPYLIGEWAPNGAWESKVTTSDAPIENTSTRQAEQFKYFYDNFMPLHDARFLGSLAFYWGYRQEYTHTWFSIFNEDGAPTEIMEVLQNCWNNTATVHTAPRVKYMLIDSLGANDNILLTNSSVHNARIVLDKQQRPESLRYHWEIVKEDWYSWGHTWKVHIKPVPEQLLIADSALQQTTFKAPLKPGPYRVYVTVYNSKGYCATANTPVYVIEKKEYGRNQRQ